MKYSTTDAATYVDYCFSITRPTDGSPPQQILLRFAPVQGRYTFNYPLHPSQQLVSKNDDEIRLRITVYDTHELRMELLSYGPEVEVLAPAALRAWLMAGLDGYGCSSKRSFQAMASSGNALECMGPGSA